MKILLTNADWWMVLSGVLVTEGTRANCPLFLVVFAIVLECVMACMRSVNLGFSPSFLERLLSTFFFFLNVNSVWYVEYRGIYSEVEEK